MNKKELRKAIKAKVAQLTIDERKAEAIDVFKHIEKTDIFKSCENIMLFASLPDEIPTHSTIERWAKCKKIYLPRVNGDNLDIIRYQPRTLHKGSYNIMEPEGNDTVDPSVLDLIIIPGVAFDHQGNRLGRGRLVRDVDWQLRTSPNVHTYECRASCEARECFTTNPLQR